MQSKSFFTWFIILALVPLVLAYLVLSLGWYTPGATNRGAFLSQELQLSFIRQDSSQAGRWHLIAQPNSGQDCGYECQELLYGLNQTYLALGKLQKRVTAQVLATQLDLSAYPKLMLTAAPEQGLSAQYLYLVDPFGKVILQYPVTGERAQTISSSKAALADIKKLLKYSRVG